MNITDIYTDLLNSFFIICMSNYGHGKSLVSTYLTILQALQQNRKIVLSNMPIYYLSTFDLEFIPLISSFQLTEEINNVQLNLDELQKIANSRDSQSSRNSFVTEFSTDVRKFNQSICGTTQFGNTIDVRLWDNATTIIIPEFKKKLNKNQKRDDFNMYLNVQFKDTNEITYFDADLKPIIQYYNTNFKPFKLLINHDDYIEKLREKHTKKYVNEYLYKTDKEINKIEKIYNIEMKNRL